MSPPLAAESIYETAQRADLFGLGFPWVELESSGVHTIALTRGRRPIGKHVPEMGIAVTTQYFRSHHQQAAVGFGDDGFLRDRSPETGPT